MQKTILITGSTDGIGLETAKLLYSQGHHVLLHGRSPTKLEAAEETLSALPSGTDILIRAALSSDFADASGKYFDNDSGRLASPHPDALDSQKCRGVVQVIEAVLAKMGHTGQSHV